MLTLMVGIKQGMKYPTILEFDSSSIASVSPRYLIHPQVCLHSVCRTFYVPRLLSIVCVMTSYGWFNLLPPEDGAILARRSFRRNSCAAAAEVDHYFFGHLPFHCAGRGEIRGCNM